MEEQNNFIVEWRREPQWTPGLPSKQMALASLDGSLVPSLGGTPNYDDEGFVIQGEQSGSFSYVCSYLHESNILSPVNEDFPDDYSFSSWVSDDDQNHDKQDHDSNEEKNSVKSDALLIDNAGFLIPREGHTSSDADDDNVIATGGIDQEEHALALHLDHRATIVKENGGPEEKSPLQSLISDSCHKTSGTNILYDSNAALVFNLYDSTTVLVPGPSDDAESTTSSHQQSTNKFTEQPASSCPRPAQQQRRRGMSPNQKNNHGGKGQDSRRTNSTNSEAPVSGGISQVPIKTEASEESAQSSSSPIVDSSSSTSATPVRRRKTKTTDSASRDHKKGDRHDDSDKQSFATNALAQRVPTPKRRSTNRKVEFSAKEKLSLASKLILQGDETNISPILSQSNHTHKSLSSMSHNLAAKSGKRNRSRTNRRSRTTTGATAQTKREKSATSIASKSTLELQKPRKLASNRRRGKTSSNVRRSTEGSGSCQPVSAPQSLANPKRMKGRVERQQKSNDNTKHSPDKLENLHKQHPDTDISESNDNNTDVFCCQSPPSESDKRVTSIVSKISIPFDNHLLSPGMLTDSTCSMSDSNNSSSRHSFSHKNPSSLGLSSGNTDRRRSWATSPTAVRAAAALSPNNCYTAKATTTVDAYI